MLRRSPRAVALWVAAGVLAVVTAGVAASDLAALHRRTADLGPERTALVARHALHLGATVTDADLAVRRIHALQLPERTVTDRRRAVGRVVRFPVARGSFVTARNLAPTRRDAADVLPVGTRAVRVPVTARPEVRPGDAVDVYARASSDPFGTGRATTTPPIATGVLVLAVDPALGGRDGADLGVTLLVDATDADAVAASGAGVVLVLVPPDDAVVTSR